MLWSLIYLVFRCASISSTYPSQSIRPSVHDKVDKVAAMVADMEVDKVANMEVDVVTNMEVDTILTRIHSVSEGPIR